MSWSMTFLHSPDINNGMFINKILFYWQTKRIVKQEQKLVTTTITTICCSNNTNSSSSSSSSSSNSNSLWRLRGLIGSALDHRSLPLPFESRVHIWRMFHLWLRFTTFGARSTHLAYHVYTKVAAKHKSSVTTIVVVVVVVVVSGITVVVVVVVSGITVVVVVVVVLLFLIL